ncbi:outer membrane immunogenic protein [Devosia sp. UYZn731]|uniref:outer membrane protein n=1 Tax=Devosia sp. UYZn731 TaxID=3156345 RepID=UPI003391839B
MNRFVLGTVSAIVAVGMQGGLAQAQDALDWSGFYAGVFGGYALDSKGATSSAQGPIQLSAIDSISRSASTGRIESLFGGVAAGYNFQVNNAVFGVDASLSVGGLDKSTTSNFTFSRVDGADFLTAEDRLRSEFSMDWYTSLTGKFGYTFDSWLVYGKGGVAVADVSVASTEILSVTGTPAALATPFAAAIPVGTLTASASQIVFGPTFGFGVEKRVSDTISVGAEYNYVSLPNVTARGSDPLNLSTAPAVFSAGFHTVKASLNYHF